MKSSIIFAAIAPAMLFLQSCGGPTEENKEEEVIRPLVNLEHPQISSFKHEIRVQGNVETDQDVLLTAEMGGLITEINVKEGQKVAKGQIIAQVDAAILSSNVQELQTKLEYAEYMLSKQEELNKRGVGSEFELETAKNQVESLKASIKSLNTQKSKSVIRAPFSGQIDQVYARKGQMAGAASPVVRLVNNKVIDIVAGISEKHFENVRVGTPISVSFPNYSDTVINLTIDYVGNYIEPTNRTFRIKSTISNNDYLLPNMLAEVAITDLMKDSAMVIPTVAVLKDQDNKDFVYVATPYTKEKSKSDYQVKKVFVEVVKSYDGKTMIVGDALSTKESIVVAGARGVNDGEIVRIK